MASINKIIKDGIDYDITDGNTYSTEEQIIGTWVDGKPIYRKVITNITVGQNETWKKDISDLNFEFVISLTGGAKRVEANTYYMSIPYAYHNGTNTESVSPYINNTNLCIQSYNKAVTNCYVIIEYTKTTDTGGNV